MPVSRRVVCIAVAVSLVSLSPRLYAESPAETTPEVTPETPPETPSALITATRFATTIDTAPAQVMVITAQEIQDSRALNLIDVLQQLGGVRVTAGTGFGADLAGFGETGTLNTLVLLNGRRLNDVDLSGANLDAIALQAIERVEIIRGTSTVLYGDNAVGGVINIVTKTGYDGPAISAQLRQGSFSTTEIGAQGRWSNDAVAIVADVNRYAQHGYREHSQAESARGMSELTVPLGDLTLGARLYAYRDDKELPGALTEDQYKDDASAAGNFLMNTSESSQSAEFFLNGAALAIELAFRAKEQDTATLSGTTDADLTTLSLTPRYRLSDESGHTIFGADVYRSALETNGHFAANIFAPETSNTSDVTRTSVALYAQESMMLFPALSLELGARAQHVAVDLKSTDEIADTATKDDNEDMAYAWDAALQFRLSGGARSHVRFARSFRFAVLDEMWSIITGSIALLDPQVGRHIEAGGQFPITASTQFDASFFRISLDDEIAFDPFLYENVNLDPTEHYGSDLRLKTRPVAPWELQLMHSYREATFRSGPLKGNNIPAIPRHTFTVGNRYDTGVAGMFFLDALIVGERYFGSDFGNDGKKMDRYTHLNAGWNFNFPHGGVRVAVNNLTDKKSADTGIFTEFGGTEYYNYYPLPGRSYSVAARVEF